MAARTGQKARAVREAKLDALHVNEDEHHEIDQVLVDLEAEEADQEAARGYASPPLSRAIARLRRLTTLTADPTASR